VVKVLRAWNELRSMVHIPRSVFAAVRPRLPNGADVDYWLKDDQDRTIASRRQ
jgi:hypothetical protein